MSKRPGLYGRYRARCRQWSPTEGIVVTVAGAAMIVSSLVAVFKAYMPQSGQLIAAGICWIGVVGVLSGLSAEGAPRRPASAPSQEEAEEQQAAADDPADASVPALPAAASDYGMPEHDDREDI